MTMRDDAVYLATQAFVLTAPVGSPGPTDESISTFDPDNPDVLGGVLSEVQTVTVGGTPTGGTFTLSFGGQTTTPLAFNATASAVETALAALSTIGGGNVKVTKPTANTYRVAFQGARGGQNLATMTATATLTGGTSPTVTVASTVEGSSSGLSVWDHLGHTDLEEDIASDEEGGDSEVRGTRQRPNFRERVEPVVEYFTVGAVQFVGATLRKYYGGGIERAGRFTAPATTKPVELAVIVIYVDGDRRLAEYHERASVRRGGPISREAENFMRAPLRVTPLALGPNGVQWINEDLFFDPAA